MAEINAFLSEPRPNRTFYLGLAYTGDQALNSNFDRIDAALGQLFLQAGGEAPVYKTPEEQEALREEARHIEEEEKWAQENARREAAGQEPLPPLEWQQQQQSQEGQPPEQQPQP